eukprot:CAMPEP_0179287312 /NCGR_PEP_ID=MMETSP0797-20121207/40202_1 /TAXON_ID=47934 /ORGANISM="Dinophysis acuminata, Strain DAEP01" /LENGTH=36 /DNA_ID= /DNA_START= /DNA_END= /DNA_ORIENTATION=
MSRRARLEDVGGMQCRPCRCAKMGTQVAAAPEPTRA